MRQGKKEEWAKNVNRQLMSVDFHDFLQKEEVLGSDMELAREFGISIREVRYLRKKL